MNEERVAELPQTLAIDQKWRAVLRGSKVRKADRSTHRLNHIHAAVLLQDAVRSLIFREELKARVVKFTALANAFLEQQAAAEAARQLEEEQQEVIREELSDGDDDDDDVAGCLAEGDEEDGSDTDERRCFSQHETVADFTMFEHMDEEEHGDDTCALESKKTA